MIFLQHFPHHQSITIYLCVFEDNMSYVFCPIMISDETHKNNIIFLLINHDG